MDMSATPENAINHAIWINGEAVDCLFAEDRSIQYGDGFFTTISIVDHKILNWQAHWSRIKNSCQQLNIPVPAIADLKSWLNRAIESYLSQQSADRAVLKIVVSRGVGGVGYAPSSKPKLNILFYFKPHPVQSANLHAGIIAGVCKTQASINAFAGVKTLNRLENVLARQEVMENGWDEGIMLNYVDQVVCATQSNIYLVKENKIITPVIANSGVAGTTRASLYKLLQQHDWDLVEKNLSLQDVENADEIFFTNAVRGVQPVTQFADKSLNTNIANNLKRLWNNWQKEQALYAAEITF